MTDINKIIKLATPPKPTLRQRLVKWIFPQRNQWPPEPAEAKDLPGRLVTQTHVQVGFPDRLRVLLSGHIKFEVISYIPESPKRYTSISAIRFLPAAKTVKQPKTKEDHVEK